MCSYFRCVFHIILVSSGAVLDIATLEMLLLSIGLNLSLIILRSTYDRVRSGGGRRRLLCFCFVICCVVILLLFFSLVGIVKWV